METSILIVVITLILFALALFISISCLIHNENYKKNKPIEYIEKLIKDLFYTYNYEYKIVDLKLFNDIQTNIQRTIRVNLEKQLKNDRELFLNYFTKVNTKKWVRVKSYEILTNFYNNENYNEQEKLQYEYLEKYLFKQTLKYKNDTL